MIVLTHIATKDVLSTSSCTVELHPQRILADVCEGLTQWPPSATYQSSTEAVMSDVFGILVVITHNQIFCLCIHSELLVEKQIIPPDSDGLDIKKCFVWYQLTYCEASQKILEVSQELLIIQFAKVFITLGTIHIHRKYSPTPETDSLMSKHFCLLCFSEQ